MNKNYTLTSILLAVLICQELARNDDLEHFEKVSQKLQHTLLNEEIEESYNFANKLYEEFVNSIEGNNDYEEEDFYNYREKIIYDPKIAEVWKYGVKNHLTIKMTYTSESSGTQERLVDTYSTSTPYGEGWCHKHKEERKFRFDRISKITLTDKKFKKKHVDQDLF